MPKTFERHNFLLDYKVSLAEEKVFHTISAIIVVPQE